MFDLGMQELIVIFVVVLVIFGPQKLPELARSLGKGMAELKKTMQGVKAQIDAEVEGVDDSIKQYPPRRENEAEGPGEGAQASLSVDEGAGEGSAPAGEEPGRKPE